jgi:hypothetical protein
MLRDELNLNNTVLTCMQEIAEVEWQYGYAKMDFYFAFGEYKHSGSRI